MTKARIFDETVAKGLPVTGLKVINIVVDYSAKMDALLVGMWKLMADLHSAVLLTRSIDLTDFPELPVAEILQGLSTPTKGPGVQTASPDPPADPGSSTRTLPTDEPPLPDAPPTDPPLPSKPRPSNPPPPSLAPPKVPSTVPPPSLPRPKPPIRGPVLPTPVRAPPLFQTPVGPTQRNLPFSQGRGRGDKSQPSPRFSHLLRSTTETGDVPAPPKSTPPAPARKDLPPPTEVVESVSDLDESTDGDSGSGFEFVLESEAEPVPAPARKKAPKTRSARQALKAKVAPRTQSPAEKGAPSKKARK